MATEVMEAFSLLFQTGYLSYHKPALSKDQAKIFLAAKSIGETLFSVLICFFTILTILERRTGYSPSKVNATTAQVSILDEPTKAELLTEELILVVLIPFMILSIGTLLSVIRGYDFVLKSIHMLYVVFYSVVCATFGVFLVIFFIGLLVEIFSSTDAHFSLLVFSLLGTSVYGLMNYAVWTHGLMEMLVENNKTPLFNNPLNEEHEEGHEDGRF